MDPDGNEVRKKDRNPRRVEPNWKLRMLMLPISMPLYSSVKDSPEALAPSV